MTLIIVGLSAVVGLLFFEASKNRIGVAVMKMTAATTFLLLALASGAMHSRYGQILFPGLVLCWIGDALLLSAGPSKRFQLGIAAFLSGHLAYAAAFVEWGIDPIGAFGIGLVIATGAVTASTWLRPHLPSEFRIAVMAYIGVISLMVTMSVSVVIAGGPLRIAIGAIGFALSDLSVARQRFIAPGFVNSAWGLPLYFGSQFLLATSVALESTP